ncbi:UDP-N-acetylglucosamine--N-acetylmuramyl-(pentapeptide) pyrophosphoryl-undecaprenol N-acetylglucosamine transferase [Bienertia sinuspersici]
MAIATISHFSFKFPPLTNFSPICPPKPRSQFLCCLSIDPPTLQSSKIDEKESKQLRFVFAAGGAGGQIFPAVAIADEIKITNPDAQILFIGTDSGMESKVVPSSGYDFVAIPAAPLGRPIISLQNLGIPLQWLRSMFESWKIMKEFKPQIVIGTGGFVSFPICIIAAFKGLKMVIHEQSSVPVLANWVLSRFADLIFVAYNSSVDSFPTDKKKVVVSGNPVRLSLRKFVSKQVARAYFFPNLAKVDAEVVVLLVLGGSFGANSMNIALFNIYYQMLENRPDLHIVWETGVESFDEMESLVRSHSRLILAPFLRSMDMAYGAADLVVSRAGSMTCSELLVTGKPAILIPSPNDAEGHQFQNASLMADLAGSRIITEDELDSTTLRIAIKDIMDNELLMATMSERALQAAKPNAGAEIAERVISLVDISPVKA